MSAKAVNVDVIGVVEPIHISDLCVHRKLVTTISRVTSPVPTVAEANARVIVRSAPLSEKTCIYMTHKIIIKRRRGGADGTLTPSA